MIKDLPQRSRGLPWDCLTFLMSLFLFLQFKMSQNATDTPFEKSLTACSVPHIDPNKVLKVFGRSWPITIEPVWSRDNLPLKTPYKRPARNQKGPPHTVILWPNKPSYYVRYKHQICFPNFKSISHKILNSLFLPFSW